MVLSDVCLTSVCLSRTSDLTREQRGLGRPKLAQRYPTSHVTRTPLSRSKGQDHQDTSLSAALTHKAAAACERIRRGKVLLRCVCWAAREVLGRPREGEGRGILCRHAHSLLKLVDGCQSYPGHRKGSLVLKHWVVSLAA